LRPADLIVEEHPVPLPEAYVAVRDWTVPRRWIMPDGSRAEAAALLREMPGAVDALRCDASGCALWPDVAAIVALSPAARSRLYSSLAEVNANPQADDAFHRPASLGPFSRTPGLPPGAVPFIDAYTWDQNGTPSFSDISGVCSHLGGREACNAFVRAMLSRPSAGVRLRVGAPGVVDRAVAEFAPGRQAEVREALTTAAAAGPSSTVALATLLPPWARERLDTFPALNEDWTNCFWTSLRFLDRAPQVVGSFDVMEAVLGADFERVSGAPRFGDVALLRNGRGRPIHAANVLLAGYVYTKNGFGHLQAWRVAPLADVTADFPMTATTEYWRPRAAAPR
ncbi:MAG: hypothetical protein JWM10_3922, partial [Myxococcaceae bacterium]|nr:hypothetical protein [Myxococcaceae bacterium]